MASPFLKNRVLRRFTRIYSENPDPHKFEGYRTAESLAENDFKVPVSVIAEIIDEFKKDHLVRSDGLFTYRCKANNTAKPFLKRGGYVTKYIIDGIFKKGVFREVVVGAILALFAFIGSRELLKNQTQQQNLKDIQQDSVNKVLEDSMQSLRRQVNALKEHRRDTTNNK